MNKDVVDLLIYEDANELSSKFNFPMFLSRMLVNAYKHINTNHHRYMLVDRIDNGYYSKIENVEEMARSFLSKAILTSKDHGFTILTTKCGLSYEDAIDFIDRYCHYNDNLKDLLSAELDVSNTNIEMRDMINKLIGAFLESEEKKELAR